MIRNKEKLITEKTEKIANQVRNYIEEMDNLSDTNEFTIDNIEDKWGKLEELTRQIYKEINDEIVKQFNEKEIIKLKKASTPQRG